MIKVVVVLGKEKMCQFKVFARKIDDDNNATNELDDEAEAGKNKGSKNKSLAKEHAHKKGKSDKHVESCTTTVSYTHLTLPTKRIV